MRSNFIAVLLLVLIAAYAMPVLSQHMKKPKASVIRIEKDFAIEDLGNRIWADAKPIRVGTNWDGSAAPDGRHFTIRMLWSSSALYVRFEANQSEPLVVSESPDRSKKTMKLWDRDVCEIFLAADPKQPRKYLEFEVAPTGEWIDLAIDYTGEKRETDWDFKSGMESAAKIENAKVVMAMKIPWSGFGAIPKAGDVWSGNLFRCIGKDATRGYLAWNPTMTEKPNFHVPEKFGEFVFEK